jgi:cation transport ATPase
LPNPADATSPATPDAAGELRRLIHRSPVERCREFRYRVAQSLIFGLPVLGLQYLGPQLSPRPDEAARWVPLLQAILTCWICYIGALPMLVEGLLLVREKLRVDLIVAALAIGACLYSLFLLLGVLIDRQTVYRSFFFHDVVIVLVAWNGVRWWWIRRTLAAE